MWRPSRARRASVAVVLLIQLLVGWPARAAAAETISFTPTDDASIRLAKPSQVVGGTRLEVDGQPRKDALIRFVVSGVAGRTVVGAVLRLRVLDASDRGGTFASTATTWTQGTVTWNSAPANGATVASLGRVTAATTVEVDVGALVTGDGVYSLRLSSASANGVDYAAKEAGAATAPQLVVTVDAPAPPDTNSPTVPAALRTASLSATSIGLAWNASTDDTGVNEYQLIRDGEPLISLGGATTAHLDTGLTPATTYRYAVRALDALGHASDYSQELEVTTPAVSVDPVLVGAGDIATCPGNGDEATAAILDTVSGTVFTLGDNVYESGTAQEFADCYAPSWGRHLERTTPAVGNHDYLTPGASGYFGYFGAAAGNPAAGYYSYDRGTWHVVVLNSNCGNVGGCGPGSPQEQWLRADLAATARTNIVAIWHHARFSSGTHGSDARTSPLWQALYEYGAELAIVGHDHNYERFAPLDPFGNADPTLGIRQFVVGTGGSPVRPISVPHPRSEAFASAHGVLKLTLRADGYDWAFLATPGSTFADAGSGVTHDRPPPDAEAPGAPQQLMATAAGSARVDLTWVSGIDNVAVAAFDIERNGALLATVPNVTSYADTTVNAGQTYTYRARARDVAGNVSDWSQVATATTPVPSETLVLSVAEDSTVKLTSPAGNFGADPTVLVDAESVKDALIKIRVDGVGGRQVLSATLRLHCVDSSALGGTFVPVSSTWTESTVTWNTAPTATAPAAPVGSLGRVVTGSWYAVDLTGFLTGDGTYALRVSSTSPDGADYASSEATGGLAPVVTLTLGP